MVGRVRFELATNGLKVRCSTDWANDPRFQAVSPSSQRNDDQPRTALWRTQKCLSRGRSKIFFWLEWIIDIFIFENFELVSLVWVNPNKIDLKLSRISEKFRALCAVTMRNVFWCYRLRYWVCGSLSIWNDQRLIYMMTGIKCKKLLIENFYQYFR